MKHRSTIWLRRLGRNRNRPALPIHPPEAPAFRIDCITSRFGTQPVFTASGALNDEGTLEGAALPAGEGWSAWIGHRRLRGRKGLLFLLVDMRFEGRGTTVARGTFEILDGTEAYVGLEGYGTFQATVGESGAVREMFQGCLGAL